MFRLRRALLSPLVVCLLAAAATPRAPAQYRFDFFTTSNGLPQGSS